MQFNLYTTICLALALIEQGVAQNHGGRVIKFPPPLSYTGSKMIPDKEHYYKAPGPGDQRGPCPAMNTLANHGYIPRDGITSVEEMVNGVGEAFNMGNFLASFIASQLMITRGNPLTNQLSIGGPSPRIPHLPNNLDGEPGGALGCSWHGRFEGDLSLTRMDHHLGDDGAFQQSLFDEILTYNGVYGEDSDVHGFRGIVTPKAIGQYKYAGFLKLQNADSEFDLHHARLFGAYGEAASAFTFFANGTEGMPSAPVLSVPVMGSFFRNSTFPAYWYRRSEPAMPQDVAAIAGQIKAGGPANITAGHTVNGKYVIYDKPTTLGADCDAYYDFVVNQIPATYHNNVTGIMKQNVDTMLDKIYEMFSTVDGCKTRYYPNGKLGV